MRGEIRLRANWWEGTVRLKRRILRCAPRISCGVEKRRYQSRVHTIEKLAAAVTDYGATGVTPKAAGFHACQTLPQTYFLGGLCSVDLVRAYNVLSSLNKRGIPDQQEQLSTQVFVCGITYHGAYVSSQGLLAPWYWFADRAPGSWKRGRIYFNSK